jgi:hypothetical protein
MQRAGWVYRRGSESASAAGGTWHIPSIHPASLLNFAVFRSLIFRPWAHPSGALFFRRDIILQARVNAFERATCHKSTRSLPSWVIFGV